VHTFTRQKDDDSLTHIRDDQKHCNTDTSLTGQEELVVKIAQLEL
jgi:hypothetical protein